jgi:hypothetical protein
MKHSLTGGSNAHIWWYCPGSVYLNKVVEVKETNVMKRGTVMHDYCAKRMTIYSQYPEVTEKEKALCDIYIAHVRAAGRSVIENEYCDDVFPEAFGTIDALWYDDLGRAHICDLKTGKTPVDVNGNLQLLTYAYWHNQNERPILHICQPQISPDLQTWEPSEIDWAQAKDKIRDALTAVYASDTPKLIKGNHCSKCRASAFCPKYKESALSVEW